MAKQASKANNKIVVNEDDKAAIARLLTIASQEPATQGEQEESERANLILNLIESGTDLAFALDAIQLVRDARGFAHNASKIAELNLELQAVGKTQRETKSRLMELLKKNSHRSWDSIKKPIRLAVKASGYSDVDGFVGALKTCFVERILPMDLNPDRLRKAATWVTWTGETINRTANKPKAPPATPPATTTTAPATPPATTTTAPATPPATTTTAPATPPATTTTAPTKATTTTTPKNAPASIVGDADKIAGKMADKSANKKPDDINELEHFQLLCGQIAKNSHIVDIRNIVAGILGIDREVLSKAIIQGYAEMMQKHNGNK